MSGPTCDITAGGPGSACGITPTPRMPELPVPPRSPWFVRLQDSLGIDLRAMALFRVALAVLLIADLINRSRDMLAHYTDEGVLPRAILLQSAGMRSRFSLHYLSGEMWHQALLFVIAGAIALLLLIGWRTTLMTVLSWIMLVSLHNRNPQVLQAGDALLRLLLFWSMFLPLGARFSIDSSLNSLPRRSEDRYVSVGTAAILLQVCFMYWFTAALKTDSVWWDGRAVWYALQIDLFATPVGLWIREHTWLTTLLTHGTIWLEILGPVLAISPLFSWPLRTLIVLSFIGLHAGMAMSMQLGLFPFICMAGWLLFVPTWAWDRLFARLRTPARLDLQLYYDGDCGFCKRMIDILRTLLLLPETLVLPAQKIPSVLEQMKKENSWIVIDHTGRQYVRFDALIEVFRHSPWAWVFRPVLALPPVRALGTVIYKWVAAHRMQASVPVRWLKPRMLIVEQSTASAIFCGVVLLYVLAWNVRTLDRQYWQRYFPNSLNRYGTAIRVDQHWNMFAPRPLVDDGWYIVEAVTVGGEVIDLLNAGQPVNEAKPALVSAQFTGQRWRKYTMNLRGKPSASIERNRQLYLRYLCRQWNQHHVGNQRVTDATLVYILERTGPGYILEPRRTELARYSIPAAK